LDPRFVGSNPANDRFIRAIKICWHDFLQKEVKPLVPYRRILQRVKEPYRYEKRAVTYRARILLSHIVRGRCKGTSAEETDSVVCTCSVADIRECEQSTSTVPIL
jgi:hypothetical protein